VTTGACSWGSILAESQAAVTSLLSEAGEDTTLTVEGDWLAGGVVKCP